MNISALLVLTSTMAFATSQTTSATSKAITEQEVLEAQKEWADGIVSISKVYLEKGDYKKRASEHIKDLYAYDQGKVLFKPTLASDEQFRETYEEALSYFVGGKIAEDKGFAIKPWSKVRFDEQHIITDSDSAIAMGNYYFTPHGETKETKVEYTFGYMKDKDGKVRINLHHSSLPFDFK